MTVIWQKDSWAGLTLNFQYVQGPGIKPVRFQTDQYLQSFTVKRAASGLPNGQMRLFDRNEDFLVGKYRIGCNKSYFLMQWYWDNTPADLQGEIPTYQMVVTGDLRPTYAFEGLTLEFDLLGIAGSAPAADKDLPPRSFIAGLRGDQIVYQIAHANGWPTIGNTPTGVPYSTIEHCDKPFDHAWQLAAGESHEHFILRMQEKCINSKGEPITFFRDAAGCVNFHSRSFIPLSGVAGGNNLAHEYVFGEDYTGEVESFQPRDLTFLSVMQGGGDGVISSIDSKTGEPTDQLHSLANGIGVGSATTPQTIVPLTSDETYVSDPRYNSTPDSSNPNAPANAGPSTSVVGVIARTATEANQIAVRLHNWLRSTHIGAELHVKGTHDVTPMEFISVLYFTAAEEAQPHYLSGIFIANVVEHTVDSGGWKTTFTLYRSGTPAATGQPQVKQESEGKTSYQQFLKLLPAQPQT